MKFILATMVSSLAALALVRGPRNAVDTPMTRMLVYPAHYAEHPRGVGGDFVDVARAGVAATVRVTARVRENWSAGGLSAGTGTIISEDGYIVTNYHVVKGAQAVTVTLNNRHAMRAMVTGSDAAADIAVLKVDAQGLPFFSFGNSDELKVGQWVLAIGYPLGLESTVTAGIVSAKTDSFVQTDAAVNLGSSGGPLIDTGGRLVGINSAFTTSTGIYVGYSFAIPAHIVKKVVNRLLGMGGPIVSRGSSHTPHSPSPGG